MTQTPHGEQAFTDQRWLQFWENYKALSHQIHAITELGRRIKAADPNLLQENAPWVLAYRGIATNDTPNTWEGVEQSARAVGSLYPELVAAQWALESNRGQHTSGKHNYFGLKGPGSTVRTQEVIDGKTVTISDRFLDFESLRDCIHYLVERWYLDWKQHKGVNNAISRDEAARDLQRQGYATDPNYAMKLISLMNEHRPIANPKPPTTRPGNPLSVPYQSQNDNKSGTGYRECFSSSCAMLAMFWGKVKNDDEYNKVRAKYGDSTSAEAQLQALRSLGLRADFHTNGSPSFLEREINSGRPVAVGWLHQGTVQSPSGGGHWTVVIGYTADAWIHNDPNGEARLVQGGYTANTKGAGMVYSRRNWNPRWMPGGSGGWYLTCQP